MYQLSVFFLCLFFYALTELTFYLFASHCILNEKLQYSFLRLKHGLQSVSDNHDLDAPTQSS